MTNTYTDRMRWREDAARREAGELPAIPADAVALQALGEMAKRMGFGDAVSDAVSDAIADVLEEHGIAHVDRDEWLACFAAIEREASAANTMALCNFVVKAIVRQEAAKVTA